MARGLRRKSLGPTPLRSMTDHLIRWRARRRRTEQMVTAGLITYAALVTFLFFFF